MIWFIPVAVVLGKLVYDAVTDTAQEDREQQQRAQERENARERQRASEQAAAQAREQQRTAKRAEILADTRQQLTQLFASHSQTLCGLPPTNNITRLYFSDLQRMAEQRVSTDRASMVETLRTLAPNTAINPKQTHMDARLRSLQEEIRTLEKLKLSWCTSPDS